MSLLRQHACAPKQADIHLQPLRASRVRTGELVASVSEEAKRDIHHVPNVCSCVALLGMFLLIQAQRSTWTYIDNLCVVIFIAESSSTQCQGAQCLGVREMSHVCKTCPWNFRHIFMLARHYYC